MIDAIPIKIEDSNDPETRSVKAREQKEKISENDSVAGEISRKLNNTSLRITSRTSGPTVFGKQFTFFINVRKSGRHRLSFGKSKICYNELEQFLIDHGYENTEPENKGLLSIYGADMQTIVEIIKLVESKFPLA
jgi:hypothetical protein